ncbi:transcriptional regulator [Arthrobacter glacialis]|uniref:Transcriptional regulator n=2 Tax=Arthrobacter glacialis TaxID=1664 RepID=A0A2S3ZVU9_ARTGL|nr:transcriptional regulator [Arthrobacter glacialis]
MSCESPHVWELNLMGFWLLKLDGHPVIVGHRQQRLIAALAILGGRSRCSMAGLLWPESSQAQSAGNLRASLFQITHKLPGLVHPSREILMLEPQVAIDFHKVQSLIAGIQETGNTVAADSAYALYHADLLPGWYDDWVVFEQERLQQLRLDGLEALAAHCLQVGATGRALEAALAATWIEPLRESAQLILLQCHIQNGNIASAWLAFHEFRALLDQELGVRPSASFSDLMESLGPRRALETHAQPVHAAQGRTPWRSGS